MRSLYLVSNTSSMKPVNIRFIWKNVEFLFQIWFIQQDDVPRHDRSEIIKKCDHLYALNSLVRTRDNPFKKKKKIGSEGAFTLIPSLYQICYKRHFFKSFSKRYFRSKGSVAGLRTMRVSCLLFFIFSFVYGPYAS